MVQIFDSSLKMLERSKRVKKQLKGTKTLHEAICWLLHNTTASDQWNYISLLSYLFDTDKNTIEREVRKQRSKNDQT